MTGEEVMLQLPPNHDAVAVNVLITWLGPFQQPSLEHAAGAPPERQVLAFGHVMPMALATVLLVYVEPPAGQATS
jgi:hypothetical protein